MKSIVALAVLSALFILAPLTKLIGDEYRADESKPSFGENDPDKESKVHIIRIIDDTSGSPVRKANVKAELGNFSRRKWEGHTDSNGIFSFDCELPNGSVKMRITIEAKGFWTVDEIFPLTKERVVQLHKED